MLTDPRNDQVRYIGKTNFPERRLSGHFKNKKNHTHKIHWLNELKQQNLKPKFVVIDEVLEKDFKFWEQHYISLYRSWGFNLTNVTIGGEGGDTISKHPNRHIIVKKISDAHKGRKQDSEWKINRAATQIGAKRSKLSCKRISDAQKALPDKICVYCNRTVSFGAYNLWHGERCKERTKQ